MYYFSLHEGKDGRVGERRENQLGKNERFASSPRDCCGDSGFHYSLTSGARSMHSAATEADSSFKVGTPEKGRRKLSPVCSHTGADFPALRGGAGSLLCFFLAPFVRRATSHFSLA